ncbi:YciI family protein, partial [Actinomadura sp.]|uniref:YciI family protein n=2 Tax=Actinomadura sp. TaxID=1989 RepID=UPI0037CB1EB8
RPTGAARDDTRDEEHTVKYMLLIYNRPGFAEELTEAERDALFAEVDAIMRELQESGEWVGGEALADPSTTKNVLERGGQPAVTDGPFLEAKEHFAGFLTVDCESEERAVEIARRWPDVRFGGRMEVRAVMSEGGAEM